SRHTTCENSVVPPGLESLLPLFPALKLSTPSRQNRACWGPRRWAKLDRPSRASECRRRVDPQQPGLAAAGVFPVMRRGTLKIKAVTALQMVLLAGKSDVQFAAQHEQELLAFVGVGLAAAGLGRDAEQVRLHYLVAPGEQLHAHAGTGHEHLTLGRAHQSGIQFRGIEKIKDVGAVVAC